jgi:hypothetical protein
MAIHYAQTEAGRKSLVIHFFVWRARRVGATQTASGCDPASLRDTPRIVVDKATPLLFSPLRSWYIQADSRVEFRVTPIVV